VKILLILISTLGIMGSEAVVRFLETGPAAGTFWGALGRPGPAMLACNQDHLSDDLLDHNRRFCSLCRHSPSSFQGKLLPVCRRVGRACKKIASSSINAIYQELDCGHSSVIGPYRDFPFCSTTRTGCIVASSKKPAGAELCFNRVLVVA
jgi:hypothetical protein